MKMAITKEELEEIIKPDAKLEKITTISSDGFSLSTRIPVEIIQELDIKKGQKIRWTIEENKLRIKIEDGS